MTFCYLNAGCEKEVILNGNNKNSLSIYSYDIYDKNAPILKLNVAQSTSSRYSYDTINDLNWFYLQHGLNDSEASTATLCINWLLFFLYVMFFRLSSSLAKLFSSHLKPVLCGALTLLFTLFA